jgi:hypothetical protein
MKVTLAKSRATQLRMELAANGRSISELGKWAHFPEAGYPIYYAKTLKKKKGEIDEENGGDDEVREQAREEEEVGDAPLPMADDGMQQPVCDLSRVDENRKREKSDYKMAKKRKTGQPIEKRRFKSRNLREEEKAEDMRLKTIAMAEDEKVYALKRSKRAAERISYVT